LTKLRVLLRNYADFESALEEEARVFESLHPGIEVELTSVGIHELHRTAITDGGLREGRFDLALLVSAWLAEAMSSDAIEDLRPWQQRLPIPDWPDGWARSLVQPLLFGDQLSSLAWHDGPECLIYRSDLFAEPTRRAAFLSQFGRELAPPATWREFEETARFFTDRSADLYGTVFAAFPDGHNTMYDFALQVWSRGGELIDSDGIPQLTTTQAIAALEFYRRVVSDPALCHPLSPQLDSTQSGDAFLEGKVAMMANWFGFAARANRDGSSLAGKVAIAPIPSAEGVPSVSLSVFWALAMGSGSPNKNLAWDFLRFVTLAERDLGITRHGAVGVRLSTWRNPELQARIPVYCSIEAISLGARQLSSGPHMAAFAAIIDAVIIRTLGTTDATPIILGDAQREIESKGLKFS
jgi:multiple sugar transport system substrate-binding protein